MPRISLLLFVLFALWAQPSCGPQNAQVSLEESLQLERIPNTQPRNVIFILSDDHRYDFMGFTGKVPWLETPNMDRLAAEGAYFPNAFVTTSLCSPSRASILTGLYTHTHTVVDNQAPSPEDLVFFPQYLQAAGYETAFFGKWHMGSADDDPRPGFDHWESFKGQGNYYAPTLNINGERVKYPDSVYVTDLLTEHAIEWLENRQSDKPFFLYLSHKAVHARFAPAKRHENSYEEEEIFYPPSFNTSKPQVTGKNPAAPYGTDTYYGPGRTPDWQKMQREGWHGVDYMYHGQMDFPTFFKRYCETVRGIDESIGAVLSHLKARQLDQSTMLMYMGDNGFSFGEHGLIDKRHFYEESVKVPFLVRCPEILAGGQTIRQMVQNIDIGPTTLELMGLKTPGYMHGRSIVPVLAGNAEGWRDRIFYEYYWEYDFPHTPTMHGVRTDRYKYIRYHGIWDTNEFYDLQEDPDEMNNLIASPEHQELIKELAGEIYDWLEESDGLQIPLKRTVKTRWGDHRNVGIY
jgi:N-acetylglucosamine-6-sulfatase